MSKLSMSEMNWCPRNLRKKFNPKSGDENSKEKRARLGSRRQRNLYCSAKGHLSPEYPALCRTADQLNGKR